MVNQSKIAADLETEEQFPILVSMCLYRIVEPQRTLVMGRRTTDMAMTLTVADRVAKCGLKTNERATLV